MTRPVFVSMLVAAVLPAIAAAQEALGPEAFERRTEGRTLTFGVGGEVYGVEQYLPGRRVIWAFLGDECREGRWFPDDGRICFVYRDDPQRHCWRFYDTGGRLLAEFDGEGDGGDLVEVDRSVEPIFCPGPEVGV